MIIVAVRRVSENLELITHFLHTDPDYFVAMMTSVKCVHDSSILCVKSQALLKYLICLVNKVDMKSSYSSNKLCSSKTVETLQNFTKDPSVLTVHHDLSIEVFSQI